MAALDRTEVKEGVDKETVEAVREVERQVYLAVDPAANRVGDRALAPRSLTDEASVLTIGLSQWFVVSLFLAAGIGCCAAMFDALQWILLQAGVDDALRGRALGAWNVAIGFGWLGPLILGAIADAVSVTAAFAVAGTVLLATAAVVSLGARQLRTLSS